MIGRLWEAGRVDRVVLGLLIASCAACGGAPQRLAYTTYDSRVMGVAMDYAVYTPPAFRPDEHLPLIVFLHGGGDSERAFDQWGMGQTLDRAITAGEVPRVVIVVPDGDLGFWADWYDGSKHFETWVLDEVVPRVARRYGTATCPEGCHLIGVSMGGSGALRFALDHPDRFASVSILSGPIFDTAQMIDFANDRLLATFIPTRAAFGPTEPRDRWRIRQRDPFVRWQSPADLHGMRLFIGWAEDDHGAIADTNRKLVRHLEEHGIPFEQRMFPGEHGWAAWKPVILDVIATQLRVQADTRPAASAAPRARNAAD